MPLFRTIVRTVDWLATGGKTGPSVPERGRDNMKIGFGTHLAFSPTVRGLFFDIFFPMAQQPLVGHGLLITRFLDHTQRRITVGRTPLDG